MILQQLHKIVLNYLTLFYVGFFFKWHTIWAKKSISLGQIKETLEQKKKIEPNLNQYVLYIYYNDFRNVFLYMILIWFNLSFSQFIYLHYRLKACFTYVLVQIIICTLSTHRVLWGSTKPLVWAEEHSTQTTCWKRASLMNVFRQILYK